MTDTARMIPVRHDADLAGPRTSMQVLESLCQLAEEQLAESRHIRAGLEELMSALSQLYARLGQAAEDRTSVKIETGAKRELKPVVHVYAGDTDQAANTWLVEETIRLHQLAQAYCDEGSA